MDDDGGCFWGSLISLMLVIFTPCIFLLSAFGSISVEVRDKPVEVDRADEILAMERLENTRGFWKMVNTQAEGDVFVKKANAVGGWTLACVALPLGIIVLLAAMWLAYSLVVRQELADA